MFREGIGSAADTVELLEQLAAATRAITVASANNGFEQVVATIIVDAARVVRADRAALWLERDDVIAVIATTGIRATTVDRFHRFDVPAETLAKSTLRRGEPITWTTHTSAQRYFPQIDAPDFGSGFVSPLHIGGKYAGVLFVGWGAEHRRLRGTERSFLEAITHTCAIAVEHSERAAERDQGSDDGIAAIGETFAITVTTSDIETIVWVAGEIDVSNLDHFAHCLRDVTDNSRSEALVLDLTDVEFLSVAAARLVLNISRQRTHDHRAIELRNASANVERVLDLISSH